MDSETTGMKPSAQHPAQVLKAHKNEVSCLSHEENRMKKQSMRMRNRLLIRRLIHFNYISIIENQQY
jgi:hypothetical protein